MIDLQQPVFDTNLNYWKVVHGKATYWIKHEKDALELYNKLLKESM